MRRVAVWLLDLPRRMYPYIPRRVRALVPRRALDWVKVKRHDQRLRAGRAEALVPERELTETYRDALQLLRERAGADGVGDYLEFGVYTGNSLACMHRALDEAGLNGVRLFGFDSFQGLPKEARTDGEWIPGYYRSDVQFTRANLERKGVDPSRVELIEGWFDDTLTPATRHRHGIRKASVVMLDCDLYSSARTALEFCAPVLADDAVIVFDDWLPDSLAAKNEGEKRAFDEFLSLNPELEASELPTYRRASKVFLVSRRTAGHNGTAAR